MVMMCILIKVDREGRKKYERTKINNFKMRVWFSPKLLNEKNQTCILRDDNDFSLVQPHSYQ
jgi:hypothetical protein